MGHALARSAVGFGSGALRPRAERVRKLSSRHPHGGGLVPAARARAGHRHLQQRREYWRDSGAVGGSVSGTCTTDGARRSSSPARPAWLGCCSGGGSSAKRARQAPPSTEEELARPPLGSLLASRSAWAFILGKFLTDPAWWFYLFWLPGFLHRVYGLDLAHLGLPIIVVYQASTVGSIGGGWISVRPVEARLDAQPRARSSHADLRGGGHPVIFAGPAHANMWLAVALVGVATAAHQGWSANLYTLASDLFPRGAVGSVVGLGGLGGAVGGMLVAPLVGYWLDWSHEVVRAAVRDRRIDLPGGVCRDSLAARSARSLSYMRPRYSCAFR